MKPLIISLLLIIVAANSFAQQTITAPSPTKTDYLKKSKSQKTAAWIMLGGGIALAVGGAAVDASNWESSGGDVMIVIGAACVVGSIPLFIAAGKNKRKGLAASASLKIEKMPVIQPTVFARKAYPALSIKIDLPVSIAPAILQKNL